MRVFASLTTKPRPCCSLTSEAAALKQRGTIDHYFAETVHGFTAENLWTVPAL